MGYEKSGKIWKNQWNDFEIVLERVYIYQNWKVNRDKQKNWIY